MTTANTDQDVIASPNRPYSCGRPRFPHARHIVSTLVVCILLSAACTRQGESLPRAHSPNSAPIPKANMWSGDEAASSRQPFDISTAMPVPGATLDERIRYLKDHTAMDGESMYLKDEGRTFRFRVIERSPRYLRFELLRESLDIACLDLTFRRDNTADLTWIGGNIDCEVEPRLTERVGETLLQTSLRLSKTVRMNVIEAADVSTVPCGDGKTRLALLQVLKYGQTWYQRFGFVPSVYKRVQFNESARLVREASLRDVASIDVINSSDSTDATNGSLAQYLVELQKRDCPAYEKLVTHIAGEPSALGLAFNFFRSAFGMEQEFSY